MSEAIASMVPSSAPAAVNAESAPKAEEALKNPAQEAQKEENDYSSKFAALSRREKQLVERERKLKEIESKYKDKDSNYQSWEERKTKFKENPDSMFDEIGMSFDELINRKLGITEETPKELTQDEIYKKMQSDIMSEIEGREQKKREETEKLQLEAQEAENAQTISTFKSEIESSVKSQSDKYELINYQGNYDLVFDVVQQYYAEHDEILDIDTAAEHVEQYLESLVEGATKLKKFQSKFAPKAEPSQRQERVQETTHRAQDQMPKTLSNAMNSQTSSYNSEPMTLEESKRKAAALLRWTK
jgi:hypothetical protein